MQTTTTYAAWAAAKQIRDAADALFSVTAFEDKHPNEPLSDDAADLIISRAAIVQARLRDILAMLAPF